MQLQGPMGPGGQVLYFDVHLISFTPANGYRVGRKKQKPIPFLRAGFLSKPINKFPITLT